MHISVQCKFMFLGKGLNVGSLAKSKATEEVPIYPKMPDVVALRQFVGYPEVKPEVRSALTEGLKSYCQSVEERKLFVENSKKSDPRSKEEIERSVQLEKRVSSTYNDFYQDVELSWC